MRTLLLLLLLLLLRHNGGSRCRRWVGALLVRLTPQRAATTSPSLGEAHGSVSSHTPWAFGGGRGPYIGLLPRGVDYCRACTISVPPLSCTLCEAAWTPVSSARCDKMAAAFRVSVSVTRRQW